MYPFLQRNSYQRNCVSRLAYRPKTVEEMKVDINQKLEILESSNMRTLRIVEGQRNKLLHFIVKLNQ